MSNSLQGVDLLKYKLEILLSNYDRLRKENESLKKEKEELQVLLAEKKKKLVTQERQIGLLKFAKTIEGSSKDIRDTKLKINALIREIDKCIIQLSS